jgi:hypothetical protein
VERGDRAFPMGHFLGFERVGNALLTVNWPVLRFMERHAGCVGERNAFIRDLSMGFLVWESCGLLRCGR